LRIDEAAGIVHIGGQQFKPGDALTLDGTTGTVYPGALKLRQPEFSGNVATLLGWADQVRRMRVRANADTPGDAAQGVQFGAVWRAQRAHAKARMEAMRQASPMVGFRGCRLGLISPEINEMQVRAIISAALEAQKQGISAKPEIMVPLIGARRELELVEKVLR